MATYSKADLTKALTRQCRECNDVQGTWTILNDCTSKSCQLYPYRPGDGPGHAEKHHRARTVSPKAIAALRAATTRRSSQRKDAKA